MHPARHVKGVQTLQVEHVGKALHCGFVAERRIGVVRGMGWFRRVLVDGAVHLKQSLSLAVERLQVVVAERPRRRRTVVMGHLFEVAAPESGQAGAVHFGVPAHPVVDAGLKRLAGLGVVPGLGGDVALLDEHVVGLAVLRLPRQELAALNDQHVEPGVFERPRQGSATHP